MTAFVSFFRGINVGGHNRVTMTHLKALHESLGLKQVATYIQSGNVVFHHEMDATHLKRQIEAHFEETFGFRAEVVVRTLDELNALIENNPFEGHADKELKWIVVFFLAEAPHEAAALLQTYIGPEEIHIIGKELFVYYPEGMGRSKLTSSLIERKLKTVGTARNWNTVVQVHKMMQ